MSGDLKHAISEFLAPQAAACGFAPVDRFSAAPEAHHPARICQNAATVIVFGILMPRGVLRSPEYNLYALHRCYHTAYMRLDEISIALCNYLESQGKYLAVPVPSYAPMVFHKSEPWGHPLLKTCHLSPDPANQGRSGKN